MDAQHGPLCPGGEILEDIVHDGDCYYFGQCGQCSWHDPMDHRDIHVAETELAEHAHKEHP